MLQPTPATPRKKKKRGMWIAILAVVLAVAAIAVVWVVKHRAPPITVQTTKVSRHSLTNLVVANGQIQPVVQVTISPEVSGEIIELPVKEGQFLHKGDLLLKINPDVYIARLSQAKASYRSSHWPRRRRLTANLEKAEADYKRNKELFQTASCFRSRTSSGSKSPATWPRRNRKRRRSGECCQGRRGQRARNS